ncbi:MAG TPA: hypothetical protein VGC07_07465 [Granulicella sp.]
MEGTTLLFTLCTSAFILLATVAFNMAGGLSRPSGAYIFSYTVLAGLFGVAYKAFLGEPGQSNLQQPERTIEAYAATALALLFATYVTHKLLPKRALFPNFSSNETLGHAANACLAIGLLTWVYLTFFTPTDSLGRQESGSLASALGQFNYFALLGMLMSIIYEIRRTGGRRSMNLTGYLAAFYLFATGVLGYSKQGIFTPFACWFFTAASQRYRISLLQIAGLIAAGGFVVYYLVPYSQYGRSYGRNDQSFAQNVQVSLYFLSHLEEVRVTYKQQAQTSVETRDLVVLYYNHPQGLADRLTMIPPDDALINATENGGEFGIFPTLFSFENLIPHVIWRSKPTIGFSNIYGHEAGIIGNPEDTTTGIAFSPAGEAYHQAKWVGLLVIYPLLLIMMFFTADLCFGDTRESPFSLLLLIVLLHIAPEGGITILTRISFQMIPVIFVIGFLCVRVFPLLSRAFSVRKTPVLSPFIAAAVQHPRQETAEPATAPAAAPYRWSNAASRE